MTKAAFEVFFMFIIVSYLLFIFHGMRQAGCGHVDDLKTLLTEPLKKIYQ